MDHLQHSLKSTPPITSDRTMDNAVRPASAQSCRTVSVAGILGSTGPATGAEPMMNRNIGILFGVVAPAARVAPDGITVKTPIAEHSSIGFELRFQSLVRGGRVLAFPCDPQGRVDLNAVSDRMRNDYLFARAMVGREYAVPVVQQLHWSSAP